MSNLSLRQLRAFEAVSRNGSFVGAARELHVTQSALSETIKNLEEAVGIRLLERSTRRLAEVRCAADPQSSKGSSAARNAFCHSFRSASGQAAKASSNIGAPRALGMAINPLICAVPVSKHGTACVQREPAR